MNIHIGPKVTKMLTQVRMWSEMELECGTCLSISEREMCAMFVAMPA